MKIFAAGIMVFSLVTSVAMSQVPPPPLPGYGEAGKATPAAKPVPPPPAPPKAPAKAAVSGAGEGAAAVPPPSTGRTAAPAASNEPAVVEAAPVGKALLRIGAPLKINKPGSGIVEAQATFVDATGEAREAVVRGRVMPAAERPDGVAIKVDWTGATVSGGGSVAFPTPLVSNLLAGPGDVGGAVSIGTAVPAYGDVDGALSAIKRAKAPEGGKTSVRDSETDTKANPAIMTGSPVNKTQPSSYQALTPNPTTADTKERTVSVTVEKCGEHEVSVEEGYVYAKQQTVTTTDGDRSVGACQRALPGIPIQWSNEGCSNVIDADGTFAQKQRKAFWVDEQAVTQPIGGCEGDPNVKFPIKVTEEGCSVDKDLINKVASKMVRSIYADTTTGVEVEVAACAKAEPAVTWPITETRCPNLRPDFAAGFAYLTTTMSYMRDGVLVQVASCIDSADGTKYPIVVEACADSVDLVGKTAVAQSRKKADTEYLTVCAPSGQQTAVLESVEGCESYHNDYMEGSFSRGGRRWYYDLGGNRTWLSNTCEESETVYPHQYVVEGWVNDDQARTGTDQLAVYIDLPAPAGRTLISPAAVRANSVAYPYTLTQFNVTTPNGSSTYQGCDAYRGTDVADIYTRPDNTQYTLAKGAGTPTGPVNVCVATVIDTRNLQTGFGSITSFTQTGGGEGGGWVGNYTWTYWWQVVNKTQTKNTENGVVISTTCGFPNGQTFMGWTTQSSCSQDMGGCQPGNAANSQTLFVPPCPF